VTRVQTCALPICPRPPTCSTWPSHACAPWPSAPGVRPSRAGRSSRSGCAPICRAWTPSASATARWTEMAESPRTHPHGRSADDARRRIQRPRRTRRVRIAQLFVFSVRAIALLGVAASALAELREPGAERGVIEDKTFGAASSELTCPEPDAVPLPPGEVTVQVLNGTTRSGLAGDVSGQLAERGYEIDDIGNTGQ